MVALVTVGSALDWGSALSAVIAAVLWVRSANVPIPDMRITFDNDGSAPAPAVLAIRQSARLSQLAAWAAAVSAAYAALGKMLALVTG